MKDYETNLFGEKVEAVEEELDEAGSEVVESRGFNIFALTDAVAGRDKRNAWMIFQKALASGMDAEEIFWPLLWGVKSLILAKRCKSAEEAGMKDFVYRKFKSALKNWQEGEVESLSEKLVVGYHEARRGNGEIETMIEKFLLSL